MPPEHVVKRFDDELEKLDASISEMGGLPCHVRAAMAREIVGL